MGPGSPDAALTAVGFAGRRFALQAGRQVFLVAPVLRAGPLGQSAADSRSVGALSARVR